MSAPKVSTIADLTAAYEPGIGVLEFVRKFEFTAPDGFDQKNGQGSEFSDELKDQALKPIQEIF